MNVPKLRFKDENGQDFPAWETNSIGNLFTIKVGGDIQKNVISHIKTDKYQYPIFSNSEKNLGLFGYTELFTIDSPSITVTGRGALGIATPRYEPYYPIVRLLSLIPKLAFNIYFGATAINKLDIFVESTGVPQLTAPQMSQYVIKFPVLKEQTKIANFLAAVDEKIAQLIQQVFLLQRYKKGVMQQIFSQQLRFKDEDGNDFPEWEENSLGEIASFIKDGTHGTHQDTENGKYLLLSAKNIKNGRIYYDDSDRRIDKAEFETIYKNYKLHDGDVLLSVVGTIGRVAIYSSDFEHVAFQRSVAFFRFKNENSQFMAQLFSAEKFQNDLLLNQVVSAQPGIYLGDLAKIYVSVPSLLEQTKIANFLSAIDDKITNAQQQLDATKQYKKSLLQQMFV